MRGILIVTVEKVWGGRRVGDVDGEGWGQWRMHCTRMGEEEEKEEEG